MDNGTKLVLTYDGKDLTVHGEGVPMQLAIWMLETAKVSLITGSGKRRRFNIEGLDLRPLDLRKVGKK